MKFLNIGLVALSSLLATSYAAPTNGLLPDVEVEVPKVPDVAVNVPEVPKLPALPTLPKTPATEILDRRGKVVYTKVQETVVIVKKHCGAINSTVDGVAGGQVAEKKEAIIKLVKTEVTTIVSLVNKLVGEVIELLGESVEIVGEEKQEIISLVLELVFDIIYALKNVIKVLGISKFPPCPANIL